MTATFPRSPRRHGFTLVELLVVIAIVLVLVTVVFVATRAVKTSAAKAADMSNLKSLLNITVAAADDSTGLLPPLHDSRKSAPHWLVGRDALEEYGFTRESLYSPGNGLKGGKPSFDWWYNRKVTPIDDASEKVVSSLDKANPTQKPSGIGSDSAPIQTHYVYFANDADEVDDGWYKSGSVTAPHPNEFKGSRTVLDDLKNVSSGQSRMVFPRKVTDECWYPILWGGLCFKKGNITHCSFLKDNQPLGVNLIYLDGHAEWVPAEKLKLRYRGSGGSFYW